MIKIKARAKINLAINVLGKRKDNYHELEMVMQTIDLYDEITLEEIQDNQIVVNTNIKFLPNDETNIAYQAARLIKDKYKINSGIKINIEKNIPVSAGLAGGSTDAAAVLKGLNQLWNLNIPEKEWMILGKQLGADVPFCIKGGAALAEGIGEVLTPIKAIDRWVVLVKPTLFISTADVYKNLNIDNLNQKSNIKELIKGIENDQLDMIHNNMINHLETVTAKKYEVIEEIKAKLIECQADMALMSGSGSAVFGLYRDYKKAKNAYKNISKIYSNTFLVKTC